MFSNMANNDWKTAKSVYDFKVNNIKGEEISLEKYKGKPLIIVNVASKCGLTKKNYQELSELEDKYKETKGLHILGFPCNQFGNEEPGTSEDIVCFLSDSKATFEVFEKIKVNGDDAHPLFKYLKNKQKGSLYKAIKWNFTKFIVDKNGIPVARFGPTTPPHDLVKELEKIW